jgi:hypothetical protein
MVFCQPVFPQNQSTRPGRKSLQKYSVIKPADSWSSPVKACPRCSSPRQLNWQTKELAAFLHFGMNTFTDKELEKGQKIQQSLIQPILIPGSGQECLRKLVLR